MTSTRSCNQTQSSRMIVLLCCLGITAWKSDVADAFANHGGAGPGIDIIKITPTGGSVQVGKSKLGAPFQENNRQLLQLQHPHLHNRKKSGRVRTASAPHPASRTEDGSVGSPLRDLGVFRRIASRTRLSVHRSASRGAGVVDESGKAERSAPSGKPNLARTVHSIQGLFGSVPRSPFSSASLSSSPPAAAAVGGAKTSTSLQSSVAVPSPFDTSASSSSSGHQQDINTDNIVAHILDDDDPRRLLIQSQTAVPAPLPTIELGAGVDAGAAPSIGTSATASPSPSAVAAKTQEEATATDPSIVPSYKKLALFCGTTILIWLSEPLLSLVDTTVIGVTQPASTAVVQLASMGPATTLMDSLIYISWFLAYSTTNFITQGLATKDYKQLRKTTSHVLGIAGVIGCLITGIVFTAGPTLLRGMAGPSASTELLRYALRYSQIRALVAPFAVMGLVSQSFCLANLNTVTPAIAVVAACLLNVTGDIVLRKYGVVGAALATAGATVSSSLILLRSVRKQVQKWKSMKQDVGAQENDVTMPPQLEKVTGDSTQGSSMLKMQPEEQKVLTAGEQSSEQQIAVLLQQQQQLQDSAVDTPQQTEVTAKDFTEAAAAFQEEMSRYESSSSEESSEGSAHDDSELFLSTRKEPAVEVVGSRSQVDIKKTADSSDDIPFLSLPDRKSLMEMIRVSGPLAAYMWAKIVSYSALTVSATQFGVTKLAAHNIMMRIFFFFGCFADSLGQTVQSFLPASLYPKKDQIAYRAILKRLTVLTAIVAVFNWKVSTSVLTMAASRLANDAGIISTLKSHTLYLGLSLLLHPIIVLLESTVIATRNFRKLLSTYVVSMSLHFLVLKFGIHGSFQHVWRSLFWFQIVRLLNYTVFRKRKRGEEQGQQQPQTNSNLPSSSSLATATP